MGYATRTAEKLAQQGSQIRLQEAELAHRQALELEEQLTWTPHTVVELEREGAIFQQITTEEEHSRNAVSSEQDTDRNHEEEAAHTAAALPPPYRHRQFQRAAHHALLKAREEKAHIDTALQAIQHQECNMREQLDTSETSLRALLLRKETSEQRRLQGQIQQRTIAEEQAARNQIAGDEASARIGTALHALQAAEEAARKALDEKEVDRRPQTAVLAITAAEQTRRQAIAGDEAEASSQIHTAAQVDKAAIRHRAQNALYQELSAKERSERFEIEREERTAFEELSRTLSQAPTRNIASCLAKRHKEYDSQYLVMLACKVTRKGQIPWWERPLVEKTNISIWPTPKQGLDQEAFGIIIPQLGRHESHKTNNVLTCIRSGRLPDQNSGPEHRRLELAALAQEILPNHQELYQHLTTKEKLTWKEQQAAELQWKELAGIVLNWFNYEDNKKWLQYALMLFPSTNSFYQNENLWATCKEGKWDFAQICQRVQSTQLPYSEMMLETSSAAIAEEEQLERKALVDQAWHNTYRIKQNQDACTRFARENSPDKDKARGLINTQQQTEFERIQDQQRKEYAALSIEEAMKKGTVNPTEFDQWAAHLEQFKPSWSRAPHLEMLSKYDMLSPYILNGGRNPNTIVKLAEWQNKTSPITPKAVLYAASHLQDGFGPILESAKTHLENRQFHAEVLCVACRHKNTHAIRHCCVVPTIFKVINIPNSEGMTALHYAAQNNDVTLIQTLLQHGADPLAKNREGQIPVALCHKQEAKFVLTAFRGPANTNNLDREMPRYPQDYHYGETDTHCKYPVQTLSPYVLENLNRDQIIERMVSIECLNYMQKRGPNQCPNYELIARAGIDAPTSMEDKTPRLLDFAIHWLRTNGSSEIERILQDPSIPSGVQEALKTEPEIWQPSLAPNRSGIFRAQLVSTDGAHRNWFHESEARLREAGYKAVLCDSRVSGIKLPTHLQNLQIVRFPDGQAKDHPRAILCYSSNLFLCGSPEGLIRAISHHKLPICCVEEFRNDSLWQELLAIADYYFPGGILPQFLRTPIENIPDGIFAPLTFDERHPPAGFPSSEARPPLEEHRAYLKQLQADWSKLCYMIGHYHNAKKIAKQKKARELYEQEYPGAIEAILKCQYLQQSLNEDRKQSVMGYIVQGLYKEAEEREKRRLQSTD